MNTQKEARRDAEEFARAMMFYGDGAGNRRKLIGWTVDEKARRDPAYGRAFQAALARQDMAEHAQKARKERERLDKASAVSKNVKGIATGNYKSVDAGVLVVVTAAYFAHKTGYDKKILDEAKKQLEVGKRKYRELKLKYKMKRSNINPSN